MAKGDDAEEVQKAPAAPVAAPKAAEPTPEPGAAMADDVPESALNNVMADLGQSPEVAKELKGSLDAAGDGDFDEAAYVKLQASVQCQKDLQDKSKVAEYNLVHDKDPLKQLCHTLLTGTVEYANSIPKDKPVGMALIDHAGHEVGCTNQPKGRMLIKIARGKYHTLAKHNWDLTTLKPAPPAPMKKIVKVLAGFAKEMPVEGACLIEYPQLETGATGTGFFGVAGRSQSSVDLAICKEGLRRAGFIEITDKPGFFTPPPPAEGPAAAAAVKEPAAAEEELAAAEDEPAAADELAVAAEESAVAAEEPAAAAEAPAAAEVEPPSAAQ